MSNKNNDIKKTADIEKNDDVFSLPKKVIVLQSFVLTLRMAGNSGATVTKSFREGQIIHNHETIKQLIEHDAPVEEI